jgi:hypothetical protein
VNASPRGSLRRAGLLILAAVAGLAAVEPGEKALVGRVLHAARAITVRTRGSGNLIVDLPRGRAVQVVAVKGSTVLLGPSPPDADLLRQFGVRRIPTYTLPLERLRADFLSEEAWARARQEEMRRIRERWPALREDDAERILLGEPYPGMTVEQAQAAVGEVVFFKTTATEEEVWTIGRRSRTAELRLFTEARERGIRARTFEEYLAVKARAVLRFRAGVLVSVEPPH